MTVATIWALSPTGKLRDRHAAGPVGRSRSRSERCPLERAVLRHLRRHSTPDDPANRQAKNTLGFVALLAERCSSRPHQRGYAALPTALRCLACLTALYTARYLLHHSQISPSEAHMTGERPSSGGCAAFCAAPLERSVRPQWMTRYHQHLVTRVKRRDDSCYLRAKDFFIQALRSIVRASCNHNRF